VATLGRMKTEEKTTLTKSVKPKVVKPKPTKTK
jgi:hypothetical protein